jgi:DNA-binding transcriptional ArsR family regulator
MVRQLITALVDDLDGGVASETVEFGIDGDFYTIDMSDKNAGRLRAILRPYIEAGRPVGEIGTDPDRASGPGHRPLNGVHRRGPAWRSRDVAPPGERVNPGHWGSTEERGDDRYLAQPAESDLDLREIMNALSDDVRLRLVAALADGNYHPCRPDEFDIGVHKSTLSHHFRILREAGITMTRLDGRNHHVRLRREDLGRRFPGLLDAVLHALRTEPSYRSPAVRRAQT